MPIVPSELRLGVNGKPYKCDGCGNNLFFKGETSRKWIIYACSRCYKGHIFMIDPPSQITSHRPEKPAGMSYISSPGLNKMEDEDYE